MGIYSCRNSLPCPVRRLTFVRCGPILAVDLSASAVAALATAPALRIRYCQLHAGPVLSLNSNRPAKYRAGMDCKTVVAAPRDHLSALLRLRFVPIRARFERR